MKQNRLSIYIQKNKIKLGRKLRHGVATKNVKYSVYFLIIFYLVGIVGFIIPDTHSLFSRLTPFALILSTAFLVVFHKPGFSLKTIIVFLTIYVLSFLAEMVGVYTGLIFGSYEYGNGLGLKIWETPLIIGLNWLMLVYCTNIIARKIFRHSVLIVFFGSALMVAYDFVLEKAAPMLDMWSWQGGKIPIQNYIAWFVFSLLFHTLVIRSKVRISNKLGPAVFIIQALFFVILVLYFGIN